MFTILWFWLAHVRPTNTVEELIHMQIAHLFVSRIPLLKTGGWNTNENHARNPADADLARDFWKSWWRHPQKGKYVWAGKCSSFRTWEFSWNSKQFTQILYILHSSNLA